MGLEPAKFPRPVKIRLLMRALTIGGAERQAVTLARGLAAKGIDVKIVVFYGEGELARELRGTNVEMVSLDKSSRWEVLGFFSRLVRLMRREKPDFILSYINVSNLVALALKPFLPRTKIVWGLRSADQSLNYQEMISKAAIWLERRLARYADHIIANSQAGRHFALGSGFPSAKLSVICNGVNISGLGPDRQAGRELRGELGIPETAKVIGIVGRISPVKDHPNFLEAAALMARRDPEARFLVVGSGPPEYERGLKELAGRLGLGGRITWAGSRGDMAKVYNSVDVLASSSYNEGFSNVIIEAMACGTACVVTDVGDSGAIVGGTGWVVKPRDPKALAAAWEKALADGGKGKAEERIRIARSFSVEKLVENTEKILDGLCAA